MNKSLAINEPLTRDEGTRCLECVHPKRQSGPGQKPHQEMHMNTTFDELSIAIFAFTFSSASIAMLVVVTLGAF